VSGPLALPLGLQQICTEFGAPTNTGLLSLLKGGAFVPANVPGGSIPAAPPIGILDFVGARHVARFSVDSSSVTAGGLTITSVTPNADCSLVTCILGGNQVVAHASSAQISGNFTLTLKVDLVDTLSALTCELPPGQPQNGNGYYQLWSALQFRNTVTPAGSFTPAQSATPFDNQPPSYTDGIDPYTGGLSIGKPTIMVPTQNNAARSIIIQPGNKFNVIFPISMTLVAGSGSTSKNWESRGAGANCFIEFPVRFTAYDSAGVNTFLDTILHIEIDATTGFTLP
jgi:hypothetical protein